MRGNLLQPGQDTRPGPRRASRPANRPAWRARRSTPPSVGPSVPISRTPLFGQIGDHLQLGRRPTGGFAGQRLDHHPVAVGKRLEKAVAIAGAKDHHVAGRDRAIFALGLRDALQRDRGRLARLGRGVPRPDRGRRSPGPVRAIVRAAPCRRSRRWCRACRSALRTWPAPRAPRGRSWRCRNPSGGRAVATA